MPCLAGRGAVPAGICQITGKPMDKSVPDSIYRPRGFARRMAEIEPFRVVEVLARATELAAGGANIVHMAAGEPDFPTAAPIVEAGRAALARGATHYSQAAGIPELREALSNHYAQTYGLDISPSRIMVTAGASGALLLIAALLMNPGDGMLMTDPGYPCNRHFMRLVEGRGQLVPVDASSNYQLSAELAEANWQSNTIGAMVASPANPTGTALSRKELAALSQVVRSHNGYLLVDEIYHGLGYDAPTPSVLEVDPDAFVINSFSKYFGMTGWRLGWLVAPEAAVVEMEKLAQNLFISLSTMAQYAALAGFEPGTREILEQRRDIFRQRRDFLLPAVQELGFSVPCKPQGAFYIYADASRFTDDSQRFCLQMLEEHGVALTPGLDFGHFRASEHLRFSYTTGMDRLELAVERLARVLT
jgi:aspartate/methionine/tyrosine aminotransferase